MLVALAAGSSLDLIELYVSIRPMMDMLFWLATAADAVTHLLGGPALGALHALSQHGDPEVANVSALYTVYTLSIQLLELGVQKLQPGQPESPGS